MTKIDPARGARRAGRTLKRKPATHAGGEAALSGNAAPVEIPQAIASIITEIEDAGHSLKDDPTGNALERYRTAVQRFVDAAVADSMRVNTEASIGLSRKVFSTITRIDVALSDLADAVLARQKDVLKVSTIVDQVKGLIVDLYR